MDTSNVLVLSSLVDQWTREMYWFCRLWWINGHVKCTGSVVSGRSMDTSNVLVLSSLVDQWTRQMYWFCRLW